jgi:hypothetical protein
MGEPTEQDGSFLKQITIEVAATATHPPGTELDENGRPIPPKDDE